MAKNIMWVGLNEVQPSFVGWVKRSATQHLAG